MFQSLSKKKQGPNTSNAKKRDKGDRTSRAPGAAPEGKFQAATLSAA